MLDPKLLRADIDSVAEQLQRRGFTLDQSYFSNLEQQRKVYGYRVVTLSRRGPVLMPRKSRLRE